MLLSLITLVLYILCVILGVAYVTLFERKVLSLSQLRIGPNKVSIKGDIQPVFKAGIT